MTNAVEKVSYEKKILEKEEWSNILEELYLIRQRQFIRGNDILLSMLSEKEKTKVKESEDKDKSFTSKIISKIQEKTPAHPAKSIEALIHFAEMQMAPDKKKNDERHEIETKKLLKELNGKQIQRFKKLLKEEYLLGNKILSTLVDIQDTPPTDQEVPETNSLAINNQKIQEQIHAIYQFLDKQGLSPSEIRNTVYKELTSEEIAVHRGKILHQIEKGIKTLPDEKEISEDEAYNINDGIKSLERLITAELTSPEHNKEERWKQIHEVSNYLENNGITIDNIISNTIQKTTKKDAKEVKNMSKIIHERIRQKTPQKEKVSPRFLKRFFDFFK